MLNPDNEPGRLTLIHRFGAEQIDECLPPLIEAVLRSRPDGRLVLRPDARQHDDHANAASRRGASTTSSANWIRPSTSIDRLGSILGGVHFELTGENVTECIGGARGLAGSGSRSRVPQRRRPAAELRAGPGDGAADRAADDRRATLTRC